MALTYPFASCKGRGVYDELFSLRHPTSLAFDPTHVTSMSKLCSDNYQQMLTDIRQSRLTEHSTQSLPMR
jgi:hypothetical protein